MKKIFFLLTGLLFFVGCVQLEKKGNEDNDISAEVRQALNNYFEDIRKNGLSAEFNWLDSSADFFWVPPSFRSALTYDSVRNILKHNAKANRSVDLKWQTLKIIPLEEKLAIYTGTVQATTIDTSGISNTVYMIETGTVVRRKDGWKLLCGQTAVME